MSARDHVLGAIRRNLGRPAEDTAHADARLAGHPAGPVPERATGDAAVLRERFVERARAADAEVVSLGSRDELPALVARACAESKLEARAAAAPDDALGTLDWRGAGMAVEARAGRADDKCSVGVARAGVAETGTLVMLSGPDSPVTLNFLPDLHVVLLAADDIVGSYEDAWARLRERGGMPRSVNWITGPSRSADIEQRLQLGAHGPVRLIVALA